jgi:hypothetical protein
MKKNIVFILLFALLLTGCAGNATGTSSANTVEAQDLAISEAELSYSVETLPAPIGYFEAFTVCDDTIYFLQRGENCIVSSLNLTTNEARYIVPESSDGEWQRLTSIVAFNGKLYIMDCTDGSSLLEYDFNGNQLSKIALPNCDTAMYLAASDDTIYSLGMGTLSAWGLDGDTAVLKYSLSTDAAASFGKLSDGRIVVCQAEGSGSSIKTLDDSNKTWGTSVTIDISCGIVGSGANNKLYLQGNQIVYSFDFETGEIEKLFSLTKFGIKLHGQFFEMSDSTLLYTGNASETLSGPLHFYKGEVPAESATLTIATIGGSTSPLSEMVMNWNVAHPECPIEIKDYSVYGDEAETRIMLDITVGNTPDMYDFSLLGSPLNAPLLAEKGLLENIYPYLDNDPELSRSSFFQGPLSAMEINGGLYEVSPGFYLVTALSTAEFADVKNMSIDTLESYVQDNEYYQSIFDLSMARDAWLQILIDAYGSYLIDWENGTCNFDSPYFINLIETAKQLPAQSNISGGKYADRIRDSQSILYMTEFRSIAVASLAADAYGENYSFAGFPAVGNVIAPELSFGISQSSAHKELCWQFLRTLWTSDENYGTIPFRKDFAKKQLDDAVEQLKSNQDTHPGREEAMEKFYTLLDSVSSVSRHDSSLYTILNSELPKFYNSQLSAEETAKQIQSRVSIYMSEQS